MKKTARIWIKPHHGEGVPVGSALIVYSSADKQIFEDVLQHRFQKAGIPYFLDLKDIDPGDEWEHKLEEAYKRTSCGVPILTPNSVTSSWVLYEIGFLRGRGKKVVPYVNTSNLSPPAKKKFLDSIPQFIKKIQFKEDPDRIVQTVKHEIFLVENLFDNSDLNKRVIDKLVQLDLTLELDDIPRSIEHELKFGYQVVRFGRWEFPTKEPHNSGTDEMDRLHKPFYNAVPQYDTKTHTLKIDFIIPIHKKWGTTFKLFVDCNRLEIIKQVQQLLENNGLDDVRQSGSGEKQRIYFLVPEGDIAVVHEPYENITVRNNYIFPA
jgi:hypothetical protein